LFFNEYQRFRYYQKNCLVPMEKLLAT